MEFTSEELANINSVIEDNRPNKIKRSSAIILAGVYADSMNGFIRKLEEDEAFGIEWEGVDTPDFIVDSEHLMGYIDLDTLDLVVNERANICGDYFDL